MEDSSEHLLAIVLDTHLTPLAAAGDNVALMLDALLAFCNAHLMSSTNNQLCVIAAHHDHTRLLFPPEDAADCSGTQAHYELFSQTRDSVVEQLKQLTTEAAAPGLNSSPLASALAMALCFMQRVRRERSPTVRLECRVLMVSARGTVAAQYMDLMNGFFTAQKLSVQVDACLLDSGGAGSEAGVLQQGADITGGVCLRVPRRPALLQYLLWLFLPFGEQRRLLALPEPAAVDYRAACFCHRQLVSVGFVCSVCLSIFCKFAPICSTCHTVFKVKKGMSLPKPSKRKRPKQGL